MDIRKLALIHKEGIKPPYYMKKGDYIMYYLFNENCISNPVRLQVTQRTVNFYEENPRRCNRDFFKVIK